MGAGQWGPGRLGREAGSQGCCEKEGGWSIPEAAGANGCLLGCAGPTRGSFTPGSNPSWLAVGREKEGPWGRVRNTASSRPRRAGIRLGGAPRRRSTPSLIPVLTGLLGDSPRQVGHRPWLERRCPEKQPVPGGSRDMCSTVHGSYQLSTDPPTLPCDFQPPSAVPAALMRTTGVAQPDPTLPHGHLVLVGPYAPTPITPKGKQDNKNQTPLKYPHPTRNFGPNE